MSGLKPEKPKDFLETARVMPQVYLLGCNHRQITFYSQQTRSVNLIHSLLQANELREGESLAVVGAGIAGVTAAAFAVEYGCHVDLYEKEREPLTIQRTCEGRWVHPHVYDWPEPDSLNDYTGDLPVLNWTAGSAKQVVAQIREGWHGVLERHAERIAFHPATLIGSAGSSLAQRSLSDLTADHAVVILAVGFGVEPERFGTKPYWEDGDLPIESDGASLISGFGDGALADLMRVCIPRFEHRWVKDFVAPVPLSGPKARELLAKEAEGWTTQEQLNRFYEQDVPVKDVLDLLRNRVDTTRRVVVQGQAGSYLYGSTSAIINRFVTAHIQRLYSEAHGTEVGKFFRVVSQVWRGAPEPLDGSTYRVEFENQAPFEGALVVRHGPASVLKEHFGDVWENTTRDRAHLRILPQQLDPSRLPMLPAGPLWEAERRTLHASEWWCLVLTRSSRQPGAPKGAALSRGRQLETLMGWALPKLEERLQGWFPHVFEHSAEARARATRPTFISMAQALNDSGAYRTTVRALCRADVVVADVTDFDPAMMMFLGIRAAVRRGVTIVTSAPRPALSEYNEKVPFNLRELSILDHAGVARDDKAAEFAEVIARGMSNYRTSTNYQDLPAYSQVRLPKIDWPESDVLVLCPFSQTFEEKFEFLRGELKRLRGQKANCRRVIDDPSPWLNSQRLFGAIRHADDCLIDWTEWRHNVFFELGVRLAVHRRGAICMIDEEGSSEPENAAHRETAALLKRLFRPASHRDIAAAWDAYHQPDGELTDRGETYRIVSSAVEPENAFFTPVHSLLLSSVRDAIGSDPGSVDTQELYARTNDAVLRQYRESARERLFAAWFYLENRFNPSAFSDDDLRKPEQRTIAAEFVKVAGELVQYLKTKEFQTLRRQVTEKQMALSRRLEGQ